MAPSVSGSMVGDSIVLLLLSLLLFPSGKIGRDAAAKMLENEPLGSYLVRLSAKLWGYTVSVKSEFLIILFAD